MQTKPLFAALVAVAFALPIAANAGTDKPAGAKTAAASSSNDGGAEAMFTSMDKNGDGFISKEEAANTPHAADFASLDKNGDGKLSRDEHANAKEHVAAKAGAESNPGAKSPSATSAPSEKKTY